MPPRAAPAGDPAPADEVGEEAEDLFGAGFHDDIDATRRAKSSNTSTGTAVMEVSVKIVDQKTALMK